MRHSRAMHLLESGINLIYIRDILGHTSVITTEIYAKTNAIIKESVSYVLMLYHPLSEMEVTQQ